MGQLSRGLALAALAASASGIASAQATQATGAAAAGAQAPASQVKSAPATFMIASFDIIGATKLDMKTVEEIVYQYLGPDRTTADVEAARKALQDAYASRGYESVQVDVPPQPEAQFAQGLVQITVTEAPVGQIRVSGSKYHSLEVVRGQVPSLTEGQPLNLKSLETELADANRFPDRGVTPAFKAGKVPGTIDVDLKVEDSLPLHGSIEINNDHSPSTKPLRVNASLRYTNLWQMGHTITGTYIVAPQDRKQSETFSASYTAPIMGSPLTLVLYGYSSNTNVAALGGVNVLGDGYQIGTRAVYRLPGKSLYQNVTVGFDYKNFNQNIMVAGALAGKAPIEYIPVYASYALSRSTDKSSLDLSLSATSGVRAFKKIRCFEASPGSNCLLTDQFKNKDLDSNENFVHANLEFTYTRSWPHDIVSVGKLYGQVADSHLVTNEQFAIGGLSSVRGYFQSEGVGDNGYAGSLEVRAPSLAPLLGGFVDDFRFYGFVEGGRVFIINPAPEQRSRFTLGSVGGGARVRLFDHVSAEIAVGVPFVKGQNTRRGDVVSTFSAKGEF